MTVLPNTERFLSQILFYSWKHEVMGSSGRITGTVFLQKFRSCSLG